MSFEEPIIDWQQIPFEFNGTEPQLIEVVERPIHTLPGTRKIDFHLSSYERPIHIKQTAAWLEEYELDLIYKKFNKAKRTKFIRAVWIGTGEKEYLNYSAQSGLLSINYSYMAISYPFPMPNFLPDETKAAFLNTSVGLAVKVSAQSGGVISGFIECVPLTNKALGAVIESIHQHNEKMKLFLPKANIFSSSAPNTVIPPNIAVSPRQLLSNLRDRLADLYTDETSARRIVADAGIDTRRVAFSARAIDNWHAILTEATKTHQIDALLTAVIEEYNANQALRAAWAAYQASHTQG